MLILKNKKSELTHLFEHIEDFCKKNTLSGQIETDIKLILEECFTNIISYAYKDTSDHFIHIDLSLKNNQVDIHIIDDGEAFNPLKEASAPVIKENISEQPIGGLGIHLIKNKSDCISYKRENNQNFLHLSIIVDK